jgi:hypothetical protein
MFKGESYKLMGEKDAPIAMAYPFGLKKWS